MPGIDQIRAGQTYSTARNSKAESSGQTTNTAKSESTVRSDSVSVSDQGRAINQMQQQMAAEPTFDAAKVASIKEAIANGSYVVDAEQLATNILKFEQELTDI
ncbi:flagellar biosynthesis anti-sigma factor FlgM [Vibrio ulleungensis]|jgi:negative regulator of flagellin synthesis FlgM|uniref:Negative regulator of flagellin synthesis n=1 Tax=Vibrio ulleungensis TaxID=2807619 RepID=A0ABS2HGG0_9VIBR|nr:flagellar biosynthesis anti-sigma factor FlgM [Vibrio ulleungensis]MBM7036633.1 flagellar biosynthesis anti-sigma factor FlgM [Vibrio ulleungensis]